MKLNKASTEVDIAEIHVRVGERQRQKGRGEDGRLSETDTLEASIGKFGLLQPIIISPRPEGGWWLEIGERRLTACQNLGHKRILARKTTELSPTESQIIELTENIKRVDLEWQEMVLSVARIHALSEQLDPDWTMGETADECSLNLSTVSLYLRVAKEMGEERIAKAGTVREAYNLLERRDQRKAGQALQELLDGPDEPEPPPTPAYPAGMPIPAIPGTAQPSATILQLPAKPAEQEQILQTSFLDWAPQYTGSKFNLIHCDFPYGIEVFAGKQGRGAEMGEGGTVGYTDTSATYTALIDCLCANLDRVVSVSAHIMFWCSAEQRIIQATLSRFAQAAPSITWAKYPLIWGKSDNAGIANNPKREPRHTYEFCLFGRRGDRNIVRVKSDFYHAPTDQRLHPSTKPEPMLRHFMEMLVDDTTSLLDPTCGSGAALRAAESLGATRVLGLEIDPQFLIPARLALKQARQLRAAERKVEL